jgi:4-hydroxybenzoate polyprenyltransferase
VTDARSVNRWRRAGYRVLPGDAFSYILHMRPAEWPIMAGHTALGYVLAVGLPGISRGEALGPAFLTLAIWVACLNGGTLALNSVFDRDEGDIGYLRAPPPLPRYLLPFSVGLLVLGQILTFGLPRAVQVVYAICFIMSVAYSVPPLRFKAVAGVDWLINMWGFGALTPYATWAATGRPLTPAGALLLAGFCPLFAGLYPLTQLYQFDEDRRRGDRTLALILGMRRSLIVAIGCTGAAFALFITAAVIERTGVWMLLYAVAAMGWFVVLVPWYREHERWTTEQHQRGMYRALVAWALTDIATIIVFAR